MRFAFAVTACLLTASSFAQLPAPVGAPSAPIDAGVVPGRAPAFVAGPASTVTQNSRVRAFNTGPDGQLRSLYLANGTVVDLSNDFGPAFGTQVHKGVRIHVTGVRTVINGQTILSPQQVSIGGQSFTAQPSLGPDLQAGLRTPPTLGGRGVPPPPPSGAPGMPPPPPPAGPAGHRGKPGAPPAGPGAPPAGPGAHVGRPGAPPPPPPAAGGPGQPPPPPAAGGPGQPPPPPAAGGPGHRPPAPPAAGGPGQPPPNGGVHPGSGRPNGSAPPPSPSDGSQVAPVAPPAPAAESAQPNPSTSPSL